MSRSSKAPPPGTSRPETAPPGTEQLAGEQLAAEQLATGEHLGTGAARNAGLLAGAEVIGKAFTFVVTITAARVLGGDGFGAFSYALAVGVLLAELVSWGFDPVLVQRGSERPADVGRLLTTVLGLRALVGAPVIAVGVLLAVVTRPDADSALAVVLLTVASCLETASDAGRAAVAARQRQAGVAIALVVQRFVGAVAAVSTLALGGGLVGVSLAYLLGVLVGAAGVALAVRHLGIRLDREGLRRHHLAEHTRQSTALGVDALISMALFRLDAVLLGLLRGDEELALYAGAYRLLETTLFLAYAVQRAVFPTIAATTEPVEARRGFERMLGACSFFYVPFAIALALVAEPILRLVYGADYAAGADVLTVLAPAALLYAGTYLGAYLLIALRRPGLVLAMDAAAAAINIVLNLCLIPGLGALGAAIATTTSFTAGCVLVTVLSRRVGAGWIRWDRAVAIPLLASAPVVAFLLLSPGLAVHLQLLASALLYLAAWAGLARRWAPDQLLVARQLIRPGGG